MLDPKSNKDRAAFFEEPSSSGRHTTSAPSRLDSLPDPAPGGGIVRKSHDYGPAGGMNNNVVGGGGGGGGGARR